VTAIKADCFSLLLSVRAENLPLSAGSKCAGRVRDHLIILVADSIHEQLLGQEPLHGPVVSFSLRDCGASLFSRLAKPNGE